MSIEMDTHALKIVARAQRHLCYYIVTIGVYFFIALVVSKLDLASGVRSLDSYQTATKIVLGGYTLYAVFCSIILFSDVVPDNDERILVLIASFFTVGIVGVVYIIRKATTLLRKHGYKVGWLGAKSNQFLREPRSTTS